MLQGEITATGGTALGRSCGTEQPHPAVPQGWTSPRAGLAQLCCSRWGVCGVMPCLTRDGSFPAGIARGSPGPAHHSSGKGQYKVKRLCRVAQNCPSAPNLRAGEAGWDFPESPSAGQDYPCWSRGAPGPALECTGMYQPHSGGLSLMAGGTYPPRFSDRTRESRNGLGFD